MHATFYEINWKSSWFLIRDQARQAGQSVVYDNTKQYKSKEKKKTKWEFYII